MLRTLFVLASTLVLIVVWGGLTFVGASEGWGRSALTESSEPEAFIEAAAGRAEDAHRGNLALVLIKQGQIEGTHFSSDGTPVDRHSVFQVASMSKWLTAWGVMTLVQDGTLDLDAPVSDYLTRWQLPETEFDASGVTVRRLLSHTSGLDDGLGYDGFDTPEERQTLEASLTKAADASPGNSGIVSLGAEPGSGWNYSGGGYTLLQLIIEEVTGQTFSDFMAERVFEPLGMTRSTFDHQAALDMGLAENYDLSGNTEPFRWYTALAPTALFTSPGDMATFLQAQSPQNGQTVLTDATLSEMMTPHASQMGADIWGLGVMLFAPNDSGSYIIGHDGNNGPAINTAARLDPATGDGIVVFETGSDILATNLASEWVFWKTGKVDNLLFVMQLDTTLLWIVIGAIVILIGGILVAWRPWHARKND